MCGRFEANHPCLRDEYEAREQRCDEAEPDGQLPGSQADVPRYFPRPWGAIREGQYEDRQHLEFESIVKDQDPHRAMRWNVVNANPGIIFLYIHYIRLIIYCIFKSIPVPIRKS